MLLALDAARLNCSAPLAIALLDATVAIIRTSL